MDSGPAFFGSPVAKVFQAGTARGRRPEQTLELLLPHLHQFGITRLADVTGLDRIGIPVCQAVRPNSRSLSVAQGKGVNTAAAKVSALMESLECYHAEYNRCPVRLESYRELHRHHPAAHPERLPLSLTTNFGDDLTIPWTEARDVLTGEPVWVPYELVHANATLPFVPGSGCFVRSTNGLASGNSRVEALLHGATEVIERDAQALWQQLPREAKRGTRLATSTFVDGVAKKLFERYRQAGIQVMAWDMTSDVRIACVRVIIFDSETDAALNPYPAAFGAGCHPDREIALCRALTEAAQSRLAAIAGARDDLTTEVYRSFQNERALEYFRKLAEEPAERDFAELPTTKNATIDADLALVIERLQAVDIERLLYVDLSSDMLEMAFVRAIIPGLEGPTESPAYRPGPRARRRRS